MELYWNGLKDYDYDAISAAAQAHMANPAKGSFMPKIADFVAVLRGKFESDFPATMSNDRYEKIRKALKEAKAVLFKEEPLCC